METHLDEQSIAKVLETCGRACAGRNAVEMKMSKGDLDGLLIWTKKNAADSVEYYKDKGLIRFSLRKRERCGCMVAGLTPPGKTATFCRCAQGYAKEVFETVTGGKVQVHHEGTLLSGAKQCTVVVNFV